MIVIMKEAAEYGTITCLADAKGLVSATNSLLRRKESTETVVIGGTSRGFLLYINSLVRPLSRFLLWSSSQSFPIIS